MAIYQIFVKLLDGRTQCFQISSPTISGETLKRHIFSKTKIPQAFQRVITGSRIVSDETVISVSADGLFPSCFLLLRLPGGKGGFGSLLRGAATKAGQKKTNNFDACRDMSGRRLRHVNAERKLEEWKAEAEDRRLEKLAEQFLKKKAKETKKKSSADVDKYLEKYREVSAKCMEEVEESVRQSFDVYKNLKRKVYPMSDRSSKRSKIRLGKAKVDESCSENDDEDERDDDNRDINGEIEDTLVLLDAGKVSRKGMEANWCSSMATGSDFGFNGESSGRVSDQSNLEHANGIMLHDGSYGNGSQQSNLEELSEKCQVMFQTADQIFPSCENNFDSALLKEIETDGLKPALLGQIKPDLGFGYKDHFIEVKSSVMEEPLNFDMYNSTRDLEALGMERLKMELQTRGLKCGGTLLERASRLFMLKTIPLDKLPKKLLAKP